MLTMDWHARYIQQAGWTRNLRDYLLARCNLDTARRVLEVGCGTGAVLAELGAHSFAVHGLDRDPLRLLQAQRHVYHGQLLCADALNLPYLTHAFDLTFCHFTLLWLADPLLALREMSRVTRPGGFVLAFAEPDYINRVDRPAALAPMGRLQTESLRRQGADPGLGLRLADLFARAGLEIIETGPYQSFDVPSDDAELEWAVLEADLAGLASPAQLEKWKRIDQQARRRGERILRVPTYFAFARLPMSG